MKGYHYVGLDVHKKVIAYCVKEADGTIVDEGTVKATRRDLGKFVSGLRSPWKGAMEATLFTGWVYDFLLPHADELKVGHSLMLRAICTAKKKTDRIDARKISDALRCDWFPEAHMASAKTRELRRILRYRNFLVHEATRMKNKTSGLLMEVGAQYDKGRLHGSRYFDDLLVRLDYVPESVKYLLADCHAGMEIFQTNQKRLLSALHSNPLLRERVERLMTIPGVGEVTALTWVLEADDPHRFPSIKDAASYCGLCSAHNVSAGKGKRGPLSKQRNKHLQSILIEAAKLAPRWNPQLAAVYEKERSKGSNCNEATISVARKLVAYMLCVDKSGKAFVLREN